MSDKRKSLEELVVGDNVIVRSNHHRSLSKVVRVTGKFIMVGNAERSTRFRKSNGTSTSDDTWNPVSISHATDEDIEKMQVVEEKRKLCTKLRGTNWMSYSMVTLKKVETILGLELNK